MNKNDLLELREIFREQFKKDDFCIGEEKVEAIFRKLLDEPEPAPIKPTHIHENISNIISDQLDKLSPKLENIFNRDSVFYSRIKK